SRRATSSYCTIPTSYALFYNQVSALLAARAKVRGTLRHNHAADGSFAGDARFASALVHAMAELKEAFAAFGIDIIRNGRTAGGDGLGQHGDHGIVEFPRAIGAQARSECQEMNAGTEQRIVRVT